MSGMNLRKMNREAIKKMKAQRKQQRKLERRRAAPEAITENPGATNDLPLSKREGAMAGDKSRRLASPGEIAGTNMEKAYAEL